MQGATRYTRLRRNARRRDHRADGLRRPPLPCLPQLSDPPRMGAHTEPASARSVSHERRRISASTLTHESRHFATGHSEPQSGGDAPPEPCVLGVVAVFQHVGVPVERFRSHPARTAARIQLRAHTDRAEHAARLAFLAGDDADRGDRDAEQLSRNCGRAEAARAGPAAWCAVGRRYRRLAALCPRCRRRDGGGRQSGNAKRRGGYTAVQRGDDEPALGGAHQGAVARLSWNIDNGVESRRSNAGKNTVARVGRDNEDALFHAVREAECSGPGGISGETLTEITGALGRRGADVAKI